MIITYHFVSCSNSCYAMKISILFTDCVHRPGFANRRIRHWRRKRRRACTLITRKKCALEKENTVDRVDPGSGRGQRVEVKEEPVEIARGGRRGDLCV